MYACPFCDDAFSLDVTFMSHIKVRHKTLIKSECHCRYTECSRIFNNIWALTRHYKAKHEMPSTNLEPSKKAVNADDTQNCDDPESLTVENTVAIKDTDTPSSIVEPCPSVRDFAATIDEGVTSLVTKLYADSSLPRKFVPELIENLNQLYGSTIIPVLKKKYNCLKCKESPSDLNIMFDIAEQAFSNFSTEHKNMKRLEDMNFLVKPQPIAVNATLQMQATGGERAVFVSNVTIQVIPMKSILKLFLQLPNVFDSILSHYKYCKSSPSLISAVQGELWKKIESKFERKLVLPLLIYFDDFEINNPLGSHKNLHKLGAVYFSIASLPYEYSSMLENIFLAQLHNTKDQKVVGNKRTFGNLIDQIIDLEENGLLINIGGKEQKVYFALLSIIGDNLGIHEICGFTTSFNSFYSCRVCLAEKPVVQCQQKEDSKILRTIDNYSIHAANCSNGVTELCVFNAIPSYHVTENLCLDIMHDIFEGVCRYELAKILTKYIRDDKLFSLEMLNSRIKFFDYGTSVGKNIPPSISSSFLKTQTLILSASEMKFLVCNLGLLVGDFIPLNEKIWELYLSLREIIDILLAPSITVETTELLATLISEHNSLYLELFSESLKPKHHLLLHYPRLMTILGPLIHFSCIRFEGKHKHLKQSAKVVTSRRNPAHTLALKHQLNQSYRFASQEGFANRVKLGPILNENLSSLVLLHGLKNIIPPHVVVDGLCTSWVQINGTFYRTDMCIAIDSNNVDYVFGKVKYIIVQEKSVVSFIFIKLHTVCMCRHVHAFEIVETQTWGFTHLNKIVNHTPRNLHRMADGKLYVSSI